MNTKFYLVFTLLFFQSIFAQNTEPVGNTPETKAIDKQLEEIRLNTKTFIDPKYETPLLELKSHSQKLGYDDGVLRSGDYLMGLYVGVEDDKKAAELATELKKIAKNKKDTYGHISSIYRRSGLTLGYLGLSDASLKDFQTAITYAGQVENSDKKNRLLAFAYNNMNVYYLNKIKEVGAIDSMHSNFRKSLEVAKKISDKNTTVPIAEKYDLIADIYMQIGKLYLDHNTESSRLKLAEQYLLEALKIYTDTKYQKDPINKARIFNELSRLYIQKKEPQKAIEYGEQALKLEKQHSGPFIRLQSYKILLEAYLEKDDTDKSKFYKDKFNVLNDSINYEERKASNSTMKGMVTEVDKEHKEKSRKQLIVVGVFILIAVSVGIFLWRRNNKKLRKSYELIIEKLNNPDFNAIEPVSNDINDIDDNNEVYTNDEVLDEASANRNIISKETEARILKRLETFERSEKYLKKDLTISTLSAQLNTNSKYLSEVIKNNKDLSFSNYINYLRINYIVQKLYHEPQYREYKISYLAEVSGYASPQVFVTAFKKVHGVTPSYFLQNLKEDSL